MDRSTLAAPDERPLELEKAMQGGFDRLIEEAVRANWTRAEAIRALIALSDHAVLDALADEEPETKRNRLPFQTRAIRSV